MPRAELAQRNVGVSTVYPGFIRDAGMFANSGASLPPGIGTKSPEDVARGTLRAIERNRAEVRVAAVDQKVAAFFASVAPGLADFAAAHPVAKKLASDIASGQIRHAAARDTPKA